MYPYPYPYRFRAPYIYDYSRRPYYDYNFYRYQSQIIDSQIASNYQNIYNTGYMAGVSQVSNINQYRY